jgi:hypothetical protein
VHYEHETEILGSYDGHLAGSRRWRRTASVVCDLLNVPCLPAPG